MKNLFKFSLISLISFVTTEAYSSEPLSNIAIYNRCYAQLTQQRAIPSNSQLNAVIAGNKDPIQACIETLKSAQLSQSGRDYKISNTNSSEAKSVLHTMHNLHASWFAVKDFVTIESGLRRISLMDQFDASSPALYFTQALFHTGTEFRTIATSNQNLRPIRTNMNPSTGVRTKMSKSVYVYNTVFAPVGDLLGTQATELYPVSYNYTNLRKDNYQGSFNLGETWGGGIIGSQPYLLQNVNQLDDFESNGTTIVPRKWSRSIFTDLMCRNLPVIRISDAGPFVNNKSEVAFRISSTCVQCHASMDRMAANIRGFTYGRVGHEDFWGGSYPKFKAVTMPQESAWPIKEDKEYSKRPQKGVLYYRTHDGRLINQNTNGVKDLGAKISAQDEMYVCAAKRYYEYFTGISVNVDDIADPGNTANLNATAVTHRNLVIGLGKRLKTHQNPLKLIEEILKLPHYKLSDYGIGANQ